MNLPGWQSRRLVPRWRSLLMTATSGELGVPRRSSTGIAAVGPDLLARLESWQLNESLISAAEVVESAIISGQEKVAIAPAKALLSDNSAAAPLVKAQAAALLMRAGLESEVPSDFRTSSMDTARARQVLRLHPQDALAWVELAFVQTVSGHPQSAEHSMDIALKLTPHNRHVLRSASRLYLHLGDRDRAYDLIARSSATRSDPWLVAAEIALSGVAERDPRLFKVGVNMLENKSFAPHHLTELAGAAGTQELLDGSRKRAKRLFVQSMVSPTGSSLAQAEWATPSLGVEVIEKGAVVTATEPYEAFAFHLYRAGQFEKVPEQCERWAQVEAFSIRPFEFGSIAAGHAENFSKAIELAEEGLKRRPYSPMLLNCLAYALASEDKPKEAEEALSRIVLAGDEPRMQYLTIANLGLTNFRSGRNIEGAQLYRKAIEGFHKSGLRTSSAHARVYLAREAVRAGLPEAKALVNEAQDAMRSFPASEAARVLRKLEIAVGEKPRDIPEYITPPDMDSPSKPKPSPSKEIKWTTPGWKGLGSH